MAVNFQGALKRSGKCCDGLSCEKRDGSEYKYCKVQCPVNEANPEYLSLGQLCKRTVNDQNEDVCSCHDTVNGGKVECK